MKSKVSILIVLLLSSCVSHRTMDALDRAETLLSESPDSALAIVSAIPQEDLTTRSVRARHALLMTRAQDKCYIDVVEDSAIRVAYNWYKSHGAEIDRLLSAYYLGVVLQNAGKGVDAVLLFRESEQFAEQQEEHRYASLSEQHLQSIFANNYDFPSAMLYARKALLNAKNAGDALLANYCRLDLCRQCIAVSQWQEAEELVNHVLENSLNDTELRGTALQMKAEISLYKNDPSFLAALECFRELEGMEFLTMKDKALYAVALNEGKYEDTADRMMAEAKNMIRSSLDSAVYYHNSYHIYQDRGNYAYADSLLIKAFLIQNRVVEKQLGQSVSHALEDRYKETLAIERKQSTRRLYRIMMIFLILFFFFAVTLAYSRRRNRQLLEDMAIVQDVSVDLEHLRVKNERISKLVEESVKDKVRSLQLLSDAFFAWDNETIRLRERKKGFETKEEIISTFRTQLSKLRSNQDFVASLEQMLDMTEDNIMRDAHAVLHNEKPLD